MPVISGDNTVNKGAEFESFDCTSEINFFGSELHEHNKAKINRYVYFIFNLLK